MSSNTDYSIQFNPETIAELETVSGGLPEPSEINISDLTAIGAIQSAFDSLAQFFSKDYPTTAGFLTHLTKLAENLMLDELSDSQEGLKLLKEAVEIIKSLPASNDPSKVFGDFVVNTKFTAHVVVDNALEEDASPPMGILMTNTQEDIIIYNEFISESFDHIDTVESDVLSVESKTGRIGVVDNIFRAFHSIKGAAGFLGLTAINKLCHECETMLDMIRKNTIAFNPEISDVLLKSSDILRSMLDVLNSFVSEKNNGVPIPECDISTLLYHIKLATQNAQDDEDTAIDDGRDIMPDKIGGILVDRGIVSERDLKRALKQQDRQLGDIVVDMGIASHQQIEDIVKESGVDHKKRINSIKVDTDKLETLLEMVGELVVAHSQVANYKDLNNEKHRKFSKNIANMGKISNTLQETIMSLRLIPLRSLFSKMTRLVRDTAKKTQKSATLVMSGEDTEIDKTVIEQVADPLVHLLRNAVDHGIENPDTRKAQGKNEIGTIKLQAYHAGGNVVIEISDDGKGIDPKAIYDKAVKKGFVTNDDKLNKKEILDLIFLPGFSTYEVATDISGRGVGMDVVKRNISSLGGHIEIDSTISKGTSFIIRLPLTMAIVDGMVVKIAEQRYVLPTLNIEESIKPKKEDITGVTGGKGLALQVRGELVPLIELSKVFNLEVSGNIDEKMVVIVKNEHSRCGLIISEVLQQQQVVIKNLGKQLQGVQGVSGGCILGNGRVGLILDIPSLIKLANSL